MSARLPQRPPGPPPPRPPVEDATKQMRGSKEIQRPPGAPPDMSPMTMKPPPRAPPPTNLVQIHERPPVEESASVDGGDVLSPDAQSKINIKPKQFVAAGQSQKAGGRSMFEEGDGKQGGSLDPGAAGAQADSKARGPLPPMPAGFPQPGARGPPPRGPPGKPTPGGLKVPPNLNSVSRAPRPLPPGTNSAGIPGGQHQPPVIKPEMGKPAPPPLRPPPRNRAPPKEGEEEERRLAIRAKLGLTGEEVETPAPPTTEPPLLRIKKAAEVEFVKRRNREMPEFEESDSDEEGPALVKQPLPFGVLKQALPKSMLGIKDAPGSEPANDQSVKSKKSVEPLMGIDENKMSHLVPAVPTVEVDKHFDDSKLGKYLSRGRLLIKCIEGHDIRRKDDKDLKPRNDCFIKFRLGVAERHPWKDTTMKRKQDDNPKFDDEIVNFDVIDPIQFIFDEDLQLCIELWNKSTMMNELIGSVTMSVVRFMKSPFVLYNEKVPIYYRGATRTQMKLRLEFCFEEARSGMVQVTLFDAKGLRNIDPMGQQDPYVQISLGDYYKKRSKSVKNGGTSPYFEEEDILMWADQDNWINDLKIELLDEDAKETKPICDTHFSLLPYMKIMPQDAKEDHYDLFYTYLTDPKDEYSRKEVSSGQIRMRVRFLPAGKLSITLDRAKDLQMPETATDIGPDFRMDPYASLKLDGKAVQMIKRTPADKDGGSDPIWKNTMHFDIVDQYLADLDVFHQNPLGKDVLLGTVQLSLLPVFRGGSQEYWTTLKQKKANGGVKEVGDLFVKLVFTGPMGVAYPQMRPEVDSFDDTIRKVPAKNADDDVEIKEAKPAISTVPDEEEDLDYAAREIEEQRKKEEQEDQADRAPPEFTDDEIQAAFKFIDLDRNNFVGAAEIRHILVCMGEMITDEEIDMMISMVDMDGDGQVSYKEFRSLVLHPNPGAVDMHKDIAREKEIEIMKEKQALAGKKTGLDLTTFQRQKEMGMREQKKKLIVAFVIDNDVNFEYIKHACLDFLEIPVHKRPGGRIKFPEFCTVLRIEPITEYKNLHSFYDNEELGDMDIREFLLSTMNFVEVSKEDRIRLSFQMFDERQTGFISQREVEEILRGNHMIGLASVQRKAETIMKQAHTNKAGAITMNEFVVVSKKFPNILLPAVGYVPPPSAETAAARAAVAAN